MHARRSVNSEKAPLEGVTEQRCHSAARAQGWHFCCACARHRQAKGWPCHDSASSNPAAPG